jgi:predicted PhzF superfamily epimerase YddE/YHI9
MDTRAVVLADAFAADAAGGLPVAVLPDGSDLSDTQLRTVARELAAPATAVPTGGPPESLRAVGPDGPVDARTVAVAAVAVAAERGWLDAAGGTDHELPVAGTPHEVTAAADGRAWVDTPEPDPRSAAVDPEAVSEALAVPLPALRDVGADLPPVRVTGAVDALAVPVNFLEHLGAATPDPAALADLVGLADVAAVCAFTFDTLAADAACHARTFVPPHRDGADDEGPWMRDRRHEVPAVPAVAAGVATHLVREGVIGDEFPIVECGHYLDRPGQVHADPETLRVGGRATVTVDGTVTVPPDDDEDIVEL